MYENVIYKSKKLIRIAKYYHVCVSFFFFFTTDVSRNQFCRCCGRSVLVHKSCQWVKVNASTSSFISIHRNCHSYHQWSRTYKIHWTSGSSAIRYVCVLLAWCLAAFVYFLPSFFNYREYSSEWASSFRQRGTGSLRVAVVVVFGVCWAFGCRLSIHSSIHRHSL